MALITSGCGSRHLGAGFDGQDEAAVTISSAAFAPSGVAAAGGHGAAALAALAKAEVCRPPPFCHVHLGVRAMEWRMQQDGVSTAEGAALTSRAARFF